MTFLDMEEAKNQILFSVPVILTNAWWFLKPILVALHQEPAVAEAAAAYMRPLIRGLLAYNHTQSMLGFLQTQSAVIPPLVMCSVSPLASHVDIAYLQVHPAGLGFPGATLSAQCEREKERLRRGTPTKLPGGCRERGEREAPEGLSPSDISNPHPMGDVRERMREIRGDSERWSAGRGPHSGIGSPHGERERGTVRLRLVLPLDVRLCLHFLVLLRRRRLQLCLLVRLPRPPALGVAHPCPPCWALVRIRPPPHRQPPDVPGRRLVQHPPDREAAGVPWRHHGVKRVCSR